MLACGGKRERKWGENEKLGLFSLPDTRFPRPSPQANLLTVANHFFSIIAVLLVCLKTSVGFRRGLFQFGARVHRERSTRKEK